MALAAEGTTAAARGSQANADRAPTSRAPAADATAMRRVAWNAAVRAPLPQADHSIFVGDDYLIKGVAGAILWKLLREHAESGRSRIHQPRDAACAPTSACPR